MTEDWVRIVRRPYGSTQPTRPLSDDTEAWDRRREQEEELRRTGVDPFARLWRDEPPQDRLETDD